MCQDQFQLNEALDRLHNILLILVYHMSYAQLVQIFQKVSSIKRMTHLLDQYHNTICSLEIICKHRNLNVLDYACNIGSPLDLFCINRSLNDSSIMSNNLLNLDELCKYHNLGEDHQLCSIHAILGLFCIHHNFYDLDFNDSITKIQDHFYKSHSSYLLDLKYNTIRSLDLIYISRNLSVYH